MNLVRNFTFETSMVLSGYVSFLTNEMFAVKSYVLVPYNHVFFMSYQYFRDLPTYFDESLLGKYYCDGYEKS